MSLDTNGVLFSNEWSRSSWKTTLQALPSFCDGRLSCFSFYFDNHLFSAFFLAIKSYSCHVSVVNHVLALLYPFPRWEYTKVSVRTHSFIRPLPVATHTSPLSSRIAYPTSYLTSISLWSSCFGSIKSTSNYLIICPKKFRFNFQFSLCHWRLP